MQAGFCKATGQTQQLRSTILGGVTDGWGEGVEQMHRFGPLWVFDDDTDRFRLAKATDGSRIPGRPLNPDEDGRYAVLLTLQGADNNCARRRAACEAAWFKQQTRKTISECQCNRVRSGHQASRQRWQDVHRETDVQGRAPLGPLLKTIRRQFVLARASAQGVRRPQAAAAKPRGLSTVRQHRTADAPAGSSCKAKGTVYCPAAPLGRRPSWQQQAGSP